MYPESNKEEQTMQNNNRKRNESAHWKNDRSRRAQKIAEVGEGKPLFHVYVDRGHRNGPEKHVVTDNAIVIIYNKRTGIHVTSLFARTGQLKEYGHYIPQKTWEKAKLWEKLGYNWL